MVKLDQLLFNGVDRSYFNRVIELNQIMLIVSRFVTKMIFYVIMTTELFIKYFCSIQLCCL